VKGLSKDDSFDHLEIRWRECQTLVPPSVHSSGGQYVWMNAEPTVAPEFVSVGAILDAFESVAYVKGRQRPESRPGVPERQVH